MFRRSWNKNLVKRESWALEVGGREAAQRFESTGEGKKERLASRLKGRMKERSIVKKGGENHHGKTLA